jgi:hypothetical protein
MSDARDKQAEQALDYLRIAADIELGPKFCDDKSRSLTTDEENVKEAALTSLLDYFVSDPDIKKPKQSSKSRSKSRSRSGEKEKTK